MSVGYVWATNSGDPTSTSWANRRPRVTVAPWPFGQSAAGELRQAAERVLAGVIEEQTVIRRYRREPSPLVRDAVRGWRTGRIDSVLAGDFDVVE